MKSTYSRIMTVGLRGLPVVGGIFLAALMLTGCPQILDTNVPGDGASDMGQATLQLYMPDYQELTGSSADDGLQTSAIAPQTGYVALLSTTDSGMTWTEIQELSIAGNTEAATTDSGTVDLPVAWKATMTFSGVPVGTYAVGTLKVELRETAGGDPITAGTNLTEATVATTQAGEAVFVPVPVGVPSGRNTSWTGSISNGGSMEFYQLDLQAGDYVGLTLEHTGGAGEPDLYIYTPNSNVTGSEAVLFSFDDYADYSGSPIEIQFTDPESEAITIFLGVYADGGAVDYTLTHDASDPNDAGTSDFQTGADTSDLTFTTTGDADWVLDTSVSTDGTDSLRSGDIGDSQNSTLTATVNVPSGETREVSFWWNVSSESGWDYVEFKVNGTLESRRSGEKDWAQYTQWLESGSHTLEWNYYKDGSNSVGSDAAWVDQITVATPSGTAPVTGTTANLLQNPGAEETLTTVGDIPGWDKIQGSFWQYRSSDPSPQEGTNYFYAENSVPAKLSQTVDVSQFGTEIATGAQEFLFSGYVNTWDGLDAAKILVEYLDSAGEVLYSYNSGERDDSAWQQLWNMATAPAATTDIRVSLISIRYSGTNNDGYFDNLVLEAVATGSSDPGTADNPVQLTVDATDWYDGEVTTDVTESSPFWFVFDATGGQTYDISWNDTIDGDGSPTGDIMVDILESAVTSADGGTSYLSSPADSGYDTPEQIVAASGATEVYIAVWPWSSTSVGTFGIKVESSGGSVTTPTYTLDVTVSPSGAGSVGLEPATGPYDEGTTVTMTPSTASGYEFSGWSGADASAVTDNGDDTYSITMSADRALTADFAEVSTNAVTPSRLGAQGEFGPAQYVAESFMLNGTLYVAYIISDSNDTNYRRLAAKQYDETNDQWVNTDGATSAVVSNRNFLTSSGAVTVDESTDTAYIVAEDYDNEAFVMFTYDGSSWTETAIPDYYLDNTTGYQDDSHTKLDDWDYLGNLDYDNGLLYAAFNDVNYDSFNVFTYNGSNWAELTYTDGSADSTYDMYGSPLPDGVYDTQPLDVYVGSSGTVYGLFVVDTNPRQLYLVKNESGSWNSGTSITDDWDDAPGLVELNGTVYVPYIVEDSTSGTSTLHFYNATNETAGPSTSVQTNYELTMASNGTHVFIHTEGLISSYSDDRDAALYSFDGSSIETLWTGLVHHKNMSLYADSTNVYWTYGETVNSYDSDHVYYVTTVEYPLP